MTLDSHHNSSLGWRVASLRGKLRKEFARGFVLCISLVIGPAFVAAHQNSKSNAPSAEAQKELENKVRAIFRDEYKSKDSAARRSLAELLLSKAVKEEGNSALRYVLLKEAGEIAFSAQEPKLEFRSIELLDKYFNVNAIELKAAVISRYRRSGKSAQVLEDLAENALRVGEEALAGDAFEIASKLAEDADAFARTIRNANLIQRSGNLIRETNDAKREYAAISQAQATLATTPEDPRANFLYGKYLCLSRGEWSKGMPFLAKGSDGDLKVVALRELDQEYKPDAMEAIGDLWRAISEHMKQSVKKKRSQSRALYWYDEAVLASSGLERIRLEKKLVEFSSTAQSSIDLLARINPSQEKTKGAWKNDGGILISPSGDNCYLQLPYSPPEEYDVNLLVQVKGKNILYIDLALKDRHALLVLADESQGGSRIELSAGAVVPLLINQLIVGAFKDGRLCRIGYSVRRSRVLVTIDNRIAVDWKPDYERSLKVGVLYAPDPSLITLGTCTMTQFSRIVVTEVSGHGKLLR